MVRAKFFVSEVKHIHSPQPGSVIAAITMMPVFGTYGDGKVNESWSKYTPSGKLEMTVTNPDAIDQFDVGKSYFLDFTPAD